jgi:putative chitinase
VLPFGHLNKKLLGGRAMAQLTFQFFRELFPNATDELRAEMADQSEELFQDFKISDSVDRLSYFLAQVAHESGGGTVLVENLNYSAKRLTEVWPKRFPTVASAQPYAKNQQKLANKVYAGRLGNGDEASGDGYRFRGRGLIQITGRSNYALIGTLCGLDLVNSPDLAADPKHALRVACGFWENRRLNNFADRSDFTGLTKAINGALTGIKERNEWLTRVRALLRKHPDVVETPRADAGIAATPPTDSSTQVSDNTILRLGSKGEQVRALQQALVNLNYHPGAVDGSYGSLTQREVLQFQADNGLPLTGEVDASFWQALNGASPNTVAPERAAATPDTLRALGSQIVKDGDKTNIVGMISTALGALGITNSAVVNMANSTTQQLQTISPELRQTLLDLRKIIPADALAANPVLKQVYAALDMLPAGTGSMRTIFDLLPGFFTDGVLHTGSQGLAAVAMSVIPGFGGSAAALALGLITSWLGKRIVTQRTDDHKDGSHTGLPGNQ